MCQCDCPYIGKIERFIIPPINEVQGVHRNNSVCPSFRPSVRPSGPPITFLFWYWLRIFGTWVYVLCAFMIDLWHISCSAHNWGFFWHWVYHIWHMGLSPWDDVLIKFMIPIRYWPLILKSIFFSCLRVRPVTSVCSDIGIPHLAHVSITMRGTGCVAYMQRWWSNLQGLWHDFMFVP